MQNVLSKLESAINSIYNKNKGTLNYPTDEQQELLDNTKDSLVEKLKKGKQFHSVEIRSYKEELHPNVNNPNLKTTRTPDEEPLLARGVIVKKLTDDELTLAKEVFGVVIEDTYNGFFLPVDLAKKDKPEIILENVSATFSDLLNDNKRAIKAAPYFIGTGGSIGAINAIGLKTMIANSIAKFTGGVIIAPGVMPVLGGAAVAGAIVGSAFAVAPLADKIKTIRQAAKDKKDGDEMEMAINAVSQIDYETIISTERSNTLPALPSDIEERATDPNRKFEKKNKIR